MLPFHHMGFSIMLFVCVFVVRFNVIQRKAGIWICFALAYYSAGRCASARPVSFALSNSFSSRILSPSSILIPHRPTGGKPNHAGFLPRRRDVRRNSRAALPLSDGRQRDGVHHSHYKTHQRHHLGQIPHGPTRIPDSLSVLNVQQAASENDSPLLGDRHAVSTLGFTRNSDLSAISLLTGGNSIG